MTQAWRWRRAAVPACVCLGLVPAAAMVLDFLGDRLGPDPVEDLTHRTGTWALRLLILGLAVSPLRRASGRAWLALLRRPLGLLAYLYATLHLLTYVGLDLGTFFGELDLAVARDDLLERRYITAGFAAFVLLTPLAITSTRGFQRRLGRRWQALHRLVYPAAALAALHFLWLVKKDLSEPALHAGVIALLLAERAGRRFLRKRREYATLRGPLESTRGRP